MTEYNLIKCPHCLWVMKIPIQNKMTNLKDALQFHLNFKHKK